MSRNYNVEGVVLKSFNHKDSDKIYTLYTHERGKISVFAKGVRKISSRRAGNLDTLNHVVVNINERTLSFKYLGEVVCKDSFSTIKKDLTSAARGFYISELIHRFTDEHQDDTRDAKRIFDLLIKTLRLLDSTDVDESHVVNFFEISLIKHLGYEVIFDHCVNCKRAFSDDWFFNGNRACFINFDLGGFVCNKCPQGGIPLSAHDALFLNGLSVGKIRTGLTLSSNFDDIMKMFIKSILDENVKSLSVF
jgi:DNA repair protein RecO